MENGQTKQIYKGALLLTLTGLLSKVLSAGYRIPLQNITGDIGFYIYQQIYPVLGIAMMLSLYGFPTAISKLVAEHKEEGNEPSLPSFYLPIFCLLISINTILFVGLFIYSDKIAGWMGDIHLSKSIRMSAYIFLIIPFTSIIRGVFQGNNNMVPTAISQVIEQVVRVSIILFTAILLIQQGENLYEIGSGAALGSIFGAVITFISLLFFWIKSKPIGSRSYPFKWLTYFRVVIIYGICISVNHMLLLLMQFSDAFTLVPNLVNAGATLAEAKQWKGILDRGQPLIQLGTVLGSSLALALIPQVTKNRLKLYPEVFKAHIQSAFKISFYLSIAATVGLVIIFPYVNILLFRDDNGSFALRLLACTIIFTSLVITIASVLQGLGYVYRTAVFILLGVCAKSILNYMLIPLYGIEGSALATLMSVLFVLFLNISQLKKILPNTRLLIIPWRAFSTALSFMVIFLIIMNQFFFEIFQITSRLDYLGYVLLVSILGALSYIIILVKLKGFTNEELQGLPFGELLIEAMQRRK
ncbi:putative polysaccharide biosynthesis protein [Aquibacillus rhizosphaerae]|uniref:Polysaccharide biosynthesis protein n=1 Tax=Aquibacillus rhizosphaerae TaxID=3051431 RepID=A0ABT7L3N3_9BACI|nr:polysaccharide biosynthesis protein [Aquibacillus sp. LR5S19]MDL4840479.1 polysaccharide biosynthesis protein [Aquibacillus sp. LR5S19]